MKWFKSDFFTWTDKPKCPKCDTNHYIYAVGSDKPTQDERDEGHVRRVELYACNQCRNPVRFPRVNHPQKLMETRTGRCGEWANAFCCLVRALGNETRFVVDWTDHVWVEVYIQDEKRWVHMDPCEDAYDTPLMYEKGWGKKLSYVIAFSNCEIVDVTNRYILNKMMNRMKRD
jgi:peptide-N4-(N-acetyl-beta-glucosaminyl)asparagine amidase